MSISGEMVWILVLLAFQVNRFVVGDPRVAEAARICGNRTAASSDRQVFVPNFLAAMDALTPQIAERGYGVTTNGTGNNTVYASAECMKDLSRSDCNLCVAQCKTQIVRCLPFQLLTKGGRVILDGCYLRYDDYMFFNESLNSVDKTVCGDDDFVGNQTLFKRNVVDLVRNAGVEGPKNDGFFTGFVSNGNLTVFGLAQCWEFVNGTDCVKCLQNAVSRVFSCPPKVEGRALNTGCYLRYSTTKFYNNSENDASSGSGGGSHRKAIIVASTCGGVAFLLFIAMVSLFVRKKVLRQKQVKKRLGSLLNVINKSKINFSYESLERATNYFHESNKLGQGGSGSVYKGILSNGQTVAVKRLFFITTQWVDHFFNEVNLISGIEHTNLVKLLGCSITGPESLLVYEYVPNQSLHDYLFVRKDVQKMGWEERFKIVLGTAEGLAFLHEKTNPRIIHRDIKLSNILLDNDFTPKIADFGLARMFPEDESHISTAVAGTLGYMAPEYMVRGTLTEKADVYSYGVLVFEVVTGIRNNIFFSQNSHSILHRVWNLNKSGKLAETIDPTMKGKFPEERAIRVLQIGLVCVQAAAELRPSMSAVVAMLGSNEDIPKPTQPPYLNANSSIKVSSSIPSQHQQPDSTTESSCNEITESYLAPR